MRNCFTLFILFAVYGSAGAQVRQIIKNNDTVPVRSAQNLVIMPTVKLHDKFVLTCTTENLSGLFQPVTNYVPGNHYSEVIINHRLCNNNPDAFILVTPVRTKPLAYTIYYDAAAGRWKIKIETNGVTTFHQGYASPADKNPTMVTVLDYECNSLKAGDKFNIIIDNEK